MVSLLKRLFWWGPFWVTAFWVTVAGAAVEVPLFFATGHPQVAALSLMWFTVALIVIAWTAIHRTQGRRRK